MIVKEIVNKNKKNDLLQNCVLNVDCGEIMMGAYDSCRLVALNAYSFVKNPFSKNAEFDFKKWREMVFIAQIINDAVVDLELKGIKRIIEKIKNDPEPDEIKQIEIDTWKKFYEVGKKGRRTGLGFTALGDTIAAVGLRYGSQESLEFVEELMKAKTEAEFDASIEMAKINGVFEDFDMNIENQSDFIQMIKKELPHIYEKMNKYGRRNISLSTFAPAGSISILTDSTSGVEPVFSLSYKRRKKINDGMDIKPDFIDSSGDKWQEFTVYHNKLKIWADVNNLDIDKDFEKSPYYKATAPEIDWMERIKMQEVLQKYVTHSISVTINLDKDVPVDTVDNLYLEAWKRGLKGLTIYRDGSRDGVLINDDTPKQSVFKHIPKRPEKLTARVYHFVNRGEKWLGFLGIGEDGNPYEIFTGLEEFFPLPKNVSDGWIRKTKRIIDNVKSSKYDFIYINDNGEEVIVENLNQSFNPEYFDFAKMVSGFMRHGMPPHSIVALLQNINFDGDLIGSWKAGVIRIIRKFIKMEELNRGEGSATKCPNCGDPNGLEMKEGCETCKSCGFSKCS